MRVYIAGKLNGMACEYIQNLHRMMTMAEHIRQLGFSVFVPGLDFLMGMMFGNYEYKDYFDNSQEWLAVSDVMYVCPGWETSHGVAREMAAARELSIPVCFTIAQLERTREHHERVERRLNAALPGLHEEPGKSGPVSSVELGVSDGSHPGPEHLVE